VSDPTVNAYEAQQQQAVNDRWAWAKAKVQAFFARNGWCVHGMSNPHGECTGGLEQ